MALLTLEFRVQGFRVQGLGIWESDKTANEPVIFLGLVFWRSIM